MALDNENSQTNADAGETTNAANDSPRNEKLHEFADESYEAARRLAAEAYEKAQKYADEVEAEVRSFVRREPLKAVAIAFVVGYCAARLLRR